MKYLFSNGGCYLILFNDKDNDLHYTMTDNTAGGPSIIFNRYHEKHKTAIHRVEMEKQGKVSKVCKNVVGMMLMICILGPLCNQCQLEIISPCTTVG